MCLTVDPSLQMIATNFICMSYNHFFALTIGTLWCFFINLFVFFNFMNPQ
jgi:hypothetical protein